MSKEYLFCHIPKTAGSSINVLLRKNKKYIIRGHPPTYIIKQNDIIVTKVTLSEHYRMVLDGRQINHILDFNPLNVRSQPNYTNYFSFAFVRHPYSRILSAYNYLINGGGNNILDKSQSIILKRYNGFDNVIDNLGYLKNIIIHLIEQRHYVCDENDKILVNFIGKYENLNEDLITLSPELINIPHVNRTKNNHLTQLSLTNYHKEKIYEQYKKDFEIFNYDK